jgi:site-specific DNA recombinase
MKGRQAALSATMEHRYQVCSTEVERRGSRIKKKPAIDPVEADTVRLIFRLVLDGDNGSGPMGVKSVAIWLNTHGYRTRAGATWGLGPIHALLTHSVYAGRMRFNRMDARTGRRKPEAELVFAEVPAIVDPRVFEQVQSQLKARNPLVTAPRVVTGPTLLTALAVCATCRGAMTLRTGTPKAGKVHRYYACSSCAAMARPHVKAATFAWIGSTLW